MFGRSGGTRGALLGALALGLTAAACGPSVASETPGQLLSDGAHALQGLKSFRITGGFAVNSVSVSLAANVRQDGDATGSLAITYDSASFVIAGHQLYFDRANPLVTTGLDPTVAELALRLKGQHWVQTPGSATVTSSLMLLKPDEYQRLFFSGRGPLTETPVKDSDGRAALKISDNSVSVLVSPKAPHNVLEITTAAHFLTLDLRSVDVIFENFNIPVSVSAPASSVPLTTAGLPPFFVVQSIDVDGTCSSSGCPMKADVASLAGTGTATVDFTLVDHGGQTLGTCGATVSIPAVGGTATARCRATGSGWTRFYYTGGSYVTKAVAENPAYLPV